MLWTLNGCDIEEDIIYTHLGIACSKHLSLKENISESCDKLRKTFYSTVNCRGRNSLNPLTSKRIYESVVLPRALYGSEVWSGVTDTQLLPLERTHRQCIKLIQSAPKHTRTDIALSTLKMFPIMNYIDKRKLLLLGQLCRLDVKFTIKQVFINRLMSCRTFPKTATGFIPDILSVLNRYNLKHVVETFTQTGIFPNPLL